MGLKSIAVTWFTGYVATDIKVAWTLFGLLYGTGEYCELMQVWGKNRPKDKGKRHKLQNEAERTNAIHSCGLTRSSDEVSVMEMERRG